MSYLIAVLLAELRLLFAEVAPVVGYYSGMRSARRELVHHRLAMALASGLVACAGASAPTPSSSAAPMAPARESSPAPAPASSQSETESAPLPSQDSAAPGAVEPVDPLLAGRRILWETRESGVAVPSEWQACSAPDDCVLVVGTCCDQCNGGKAVSVVRAREAEVRAKYRRDQCGACTKRGCQTRAACEAGRCVMQWMTAR